MELIQVLADIVCSTLLDPQALHRARRRKGAFTRNCGKLPYWTLIKLLLKNAKRPIAASLDEFFHEFGLKTGSHAKGCSQQAFSKARPGISHTIFEECFERVLDFLCSADSLSFHSRFIGLWGLQVIAIDGSKIPLPNRKALLEKFGSTGRGVSSLHCHCQCCGRWRKITSSSRKKWALRTSAGTLKIPSCRNSGYPCCLQTLPLP